MRATVESSARPREKRFRSSASRRSSVQRQCPPYRDDARIVVRETAQRLVEHRGEMRFQASACLVGLACLCPNEQRQRENQIRLGQIAGMPHAPALQRAVVQDLEFEPCVGEENPEAEIHGGKVREKLDLVRFAWRW